LNDAFERTKTADGQYATTIKRNERFPRSPVLLEIDLQAPSDATAVCG
jgi:hypothetical protein